MEQIATLTAPKIPPPDHHARPDRPVGAPAQETAPGWEPRPLTVIRPRAFSPLALVRAVARLAHYRDLLYTLSVHRLKVRYKQSILGPSWAVLQPLSLVLIYTV